MIRSQVFLAFFLVLSIPAGSRAAYFYVSTVEELQIALTAAESNGEDDRIDLSAGVYQVTETLRYYPPPEVDEPHSLSLFGAGPERTVLQGDGLKEVLVLSTSFGGEYLGSTLRVKGLTVRNGNRALVLHSGAAGSIVVENMEFRDNTLRVPPIEMGPPVACVGNGAGLTVFSTGDVLLRGSVFAGNESSCPGAVAAGINGGGRVIVHGNEFIDNEGVLSVSYNNVYSSLESQLNIDGNVFRKNAGRALHVYSTEQIINVTNNLFAENGGGIDIMSLYGAAEVTGNTMVENLDGGTVRAATMSIFNNILWNNVPGPDLRVEQTWYNEAGNEATIVANIFGDITIDPEVVVLRQDSNITADPRLSPDYHLQPRSPAIDAGDNSAPGLTPLDIDGDRRINNGTVDIGADEFVGPFVSEPSVRYVWSYEAAIVPRMSSSLEDTRPIGLGPVAASGDVFDVKVDLRRLWRWDVYDLYFGLRCDGFDDGAVHILNQDGNLPPLSDGLVAWMEGVHAGVKMSVLGPLPATAVPSGRCDFYLMATPAKRTDEYYLWHTWLVRD